MLRKLQYALVISCCLSASIFAESVYSDLNYYVDYKKIITDLCGESIAAAKISDEERACVSGTGASPVYGEILHESVEFLLQELKLDENAVFYDLGSGLGKFVLQVYLMSPAKKSVGIEFSQSRHERAAKNEKIAKKLYTECIKAENTIRKSLGKPTLKKVKKTLEFINADMLKADISDATVIFTCSTCFDAAFMKRLTDKLVSDCKDGVRVLSLNQLAAHEHVHLDRVYKLPMTWAADTAVYSYVIDHTRKATTKVDQNQEQEQ